MVQPQLGLAVSSPSACLMGEIPLTKGKVALVDDEDFEWLNQWNWYASEDRSTFYAVRTDYSTGKRVRIYMHRFIIGGGKGQQIDHKNGNGLDNQRLNLRLCDNSQNNQNRGTCYSLSAYKGVSWDKQKQKFSARIRCYGKQIHLGYFRSAIEAAGAYNEAAVKYFGEFACINGV